MHSVTSTHFVTAASAAVGITTARRVGIAFTRCIIITCACGSYGCGNVLYNWYCNVGNNRNEFSVTPANIAF